MNLAGADPQPPYTNWAHAALSIQDAVACAGEGATVWVARGVYASNSAPTPGGLLRCRLVVTNAITVRVAEEPGSAVLAGAPDPDTGTHGVGAVRCLYLHLGTLIGFTLSNGHTRTTGDLVLDRSGGGALLASGTLEDCRIEGCFASETAGGVRGGRLRRCRISGNEAWNGGGLFGAEATECVVASNTGTRGGGVFEVQMQDSEVIGNRARFGGGVWDSRVSRCRLSGNWATLEGGGADGGILMDSELVDNAAGAAGGGVNGSILQRCLVRRNRAITGGGVIASTLQDCIVTDNTATEEGGGVYSSTAVHCTIVSNAAGLEAGGAYLSTLTNSIVCFNRAPQGSNVQGTVSAYCCILPPEPGAGNISGDPLFDSGTNLPPFQLRPESPCTDAGLSLPECAADMTGIPRPLDGDADGRSGPDIGARELASSLADTDGDRQMDSAELACGTDPLDASSALRLTALAVLDDRTRVSWQGGTGVVQVLERRGPLGGKPEWRPVFSNLPPTAPACGFTDTIPADAAGSGVFYRVVVPRPR